MNCLFYTSENWTGFVLNKKVRLENSFVITNDGTLAVVYNY